VLLREWADSFRDDRVWAVESAQGLGDLLAQQLIAAGETVIDVPAVRASRVRTLSIGRSQKNDPNDARSVAIAALRANDLARVLPDDHTRILRLLAKRHRDLGRQKNLESCRLHALLREMFPGGADFRKSSMTRVNASLDRFDATDSMGRQRIDLAHDLGDSIDEIAAKMKISKRRRRIVEACVCASQRTPGPGR
jgi:transposase